MLHFPKQQGEHLTAATRRAPRPPARDPPNELPTHAPVDSAGEKPCGNARPARQWIDNSGGQRQQIIIPGYGASSGTYTGYLDYVLTQKLCIGPPTGKLNNNKGVAVKSDQCRTKYTVKYL